MKRLSLKASALAICLTVVGLAFPAAAHQSLNPSHPAPSSPFLNGAHTIRLDSGQVPTSPSWAAVTSSGYATPFPGSQYIGPALPPLLCAGWPSFPVSHFTNVPFNLPAAAENPQIVIDVHADNAVAVRLNGLVIGGQPKTGTPANYLAPAERFTNAGFGAENGFFQPGMNVLRFELVNNFGSRCALNFSARVTFSLPCLQATPTIVGGDGDDPIDGTSGDDVIDGGDGDDTINGMGGNDIILGGDGEDTIRGGLGNDCLKGGDGDDKLLGELGNDTLDGGDEADILAGDLGSDALRGRDGDDTLAGGGGIDILSGEDDDDVLAGGGQNDFLSGGHGADQLNGGADSDAMFGGDDNDQLTDTSGSDALNGGKDIDTLSALDGDGSDTLWGPRTPLVYGPNPVVDPNDLCTFNAADSSWGCI